MFLLKFLLTVYLVGIPCAAVYYLLKGFLGVIENPDESDRAWMEERRKHPFRLLFAILELAVIWPWCLVWTIRKYGLFVDTESNHDR